MLDAGLVVSVILLLPCSLASQSLAQPRQGDPRWFDSVHFADHKFQMPPSISPKGAGWWKIKVGFQVSQPDHLGEVRQRGVCCGHRGQWHLLHQVVIAAISFLYSKLPLPLSLPSLHSWCSQHGVRSIRWCRPRELCGWLRCLLCSSGTSLAIH